LVTFLLAGPVGPVDLRNQTATAKVVATCSCGCASVWLGVADDAPRATFDPGPTGARVDWVRIGAVQNMGSSAIEVTLHIVDGRLYELEIWTGQYGGRARINRDKLERM
jgi:hypothetical protein